MKQADVQKERKEMYDFKRIYEPQSVEETLKMMKEHPDAKILAGGSDVFIQMRAGALAGIEAISIYQMNVLRGIYMEDDGTIVILPLTSFSHIVKNEMIQKHIPVLADAVDKMGGPQIRNIATIGGNVCNGHTGADSGSTLVALDAEVELTSANGKRRVFISDFYKPTGGVDLREGELLTKFFIPKKAYDGYYGAHFKYAMRNAMDVDVAGCSTNVKLSPDKKKIEDVRIAFGVMGPCPVRAKNAEEAVRGKEINEKLSILFADEAIKNLSPRTDYRATADFRSHISHVMAERTLKEAVALARGDVLPKEGGTCSGDTI